MKYRLFDQRENKYISTPSLPLYCISPNGLAGYFDNENHFYICEDLKIELSTNCFDCKKREIYEGDIVYKAGIYYGIVRYGKYYDKYAHGDRIEFYIETDVEENYFDPVYATEFEVIAD